MGGGTLISLVRFVTFFQWGGFILWPSFSQDCNCWKYIYCQHLFWWSFHDHPIVHSRPYGLFTSFAYCTVLLRNLHSARKGFIFTQLPYSPFEFNTVWYFFETFIQPVRVSFLHNYLTVLLNAILQGVYRTVQYFTFTYKGRGFLALWLDPTPFSLGHACSHVLPQSHHFQPDPPKMSCQLSSVQKF